MIEVDKNTVGMKNVHRDRLFTIFLNTRIDIFKMKPRGKVFKAKREMILCAEGNKTVGNSLPKDAKSWVQGETGQAHERNSSEG